MTNILHSVSNGQNQRGYCRSGRVGGTVVSCLVVVNLHHHFADKGLYSQTYGFFSSHIWTICESLTIKKAEHQRIDASELWCWRRLLSPLDSKEIKPAILREINPEYTLEGLMLKLKFQYWNSNTIQVAKVLEFQLQHQSFQCIFRVDFP